MSLKILFIGVLLLYLSSWGMYVDYLYHFKKQFKWYDVLISFVPIVRAMYLVLVVEDDDV